MVAEAIEYNEVALVGLTANGDLHWPTRNKREFPKAGIVFFVPPRPGTESSCASDIFHEDTVLADVVLTLEVECDFLVVILAFANINIECSEDAFLQIINVAFHAVEPVLVFTEIRVYMQESPVNFLTKFGPHLVSLDQKPILLNLFTDRTVENLATCM